jgi:hypothetical protein
VRVKIDPLRRKADFPGFPHRHVLCIGRAAFSRACSLLGINTPEMDDDDRLHFHDLRHEGISRLFEMGRTRAAC